MEGHGEEAHADFQHALSLKPNPALRARLESRIQRLKQSERIKLLEKGRLEKALEAKTLRPTQGVRKHP